MENEEETHRDICDYEFDGIDTRDYPDFCDAYIVSACWKDTGKELTEDEIDNLDSDYVYDLLMSWIF
jgi:hypothetical protein